MSGNETARRLMDAAQALIQERGYNAFSFKDLAERVGIRTASIHYHFPTKADLGVALMERYLEGLDASLAHIDASAKSPRTRLKALVKLYSETESAGAICLCGSLATDHATLSEELRDIVDRYLDRTRKWIATTISAGVSDGDFVFGGRPQDAATTLLSGLQGGLIISRAQSERASVLASVQRVLFSTLEGA